MTTSASDSIAAVQITETGGPEVMRLVSVAEPVPDADQMLVEVAAAGVNFIDTYHRSGLYELALPIVLGQEGAGTVMQVGAGVEGFSVGDRVAWAGSAGSYAQRAAVKASVASECPTAWTSRRLRRSGFRGLPRTIW